MMEGVEFVVLSVWFLSACINAGVGFLSEDRGLGFAWLGQATAVVLLLIAGL